MNYTEYIHKIVKFKLFIYLLFEEAIRTQLEYREYIHKNLVCVLNRFSPFLY